MKQVLPLFVMIDACGWEIVKDDPFARSFAPHRKRLRSVFGYSSTCVPSIVSGCWPDEHRNWCYFVYDPVHSPFRSLRWLRWLPRALTTRRIFRRALTRAVKARLGFRGYFDLYNMPFEHISLFDFSEKKSPLKPAGMNRGANIFDFLEKRHIPYFVSDPDATEEENLAALEREIQSERIDFAFLYWPGLDGLLHRVGNDSPEIGVRLRMYEQWLTRLLSRAQSHYADVRLQVFSDHGMANCDQLLDLKGRIEQLDLEFGKDYAAVYDSTMARFWFFEEKARRSIRSLLEQIPEGRILPDEELRRLRTYFRDAHFGELIYLVKEGVLIVPSHMGERPIRAMHGYHPDDKHSYATLMTNRPELTEGIQELPDLFRLMAGEAERAQVRNQTGAVADAAVEGRLATV